MLHNPASLAPQNTQAAPMSAARRERPGAAALERRIRSISERIGSALEADILPRPAMTRLALDQPDVARLCRLAIAGDAAALLAALQENRPTVIRAEQACLINLTDVARALGVWWEEDRCGFVEVTLGMLTLQQVLRDLAPGLERGPVGALHRSALMLPMPGEQHSFGISMLAEFFRAAGWHVAQDPGLTTGKLLRRVSREWFGIVALSCGVAERLPALPQLIEAVRAHSLNPAVAVMVGGAAFQDPAAPAAALAAADATATDAACALRRAEDLVSLMAVSR